MDFPNNVSALNFCLKILQGFLDQLFEIDLRLLHLRLPDAREGQQTVDHLSHLFRRLGDRRQMPEAVLRKCWPGVLSQQFDKTHDMAQRRAQIMGDGVAERLQFQIGGFQLRRALADPSLQLGILLAQLLHFLLNRLSVVCAQDALHRRQHIIFGKGPLERRVGL